MVTAKEIRAMLAKYIAEEIDLDSFEDWIAQQTWGSRSGSDPSVVALVGDIELRLSEYSNGHLPLEQMRAEFREIAEGMPVMNVRIVHDNLARYAVSGGTSAIPSAASGVVGMGGQWFEISSEEVRALGGSLQSSHQSSAGPPLAYSAR